MILYAAPAPSKFFDGSPAATQYKKGQNFINVQKFFPCLHKNEKGCKYDNRKIFKICLKSLCHKVDLGAPDGAA
jgi:hypothetical protein